MAEIIIGDPNRFKAGRMRCNPCKCGRIPEYTIGSDGEHQIWCQDCDDIPDVENTNLDQAINEWNNYMDGLKMAGVNHER